MRAVVALLLAATTGTTPQVTAAPSPYVVYEIVRVKPGGPATVPIELTGRTEGPPGVMGYLELRRGRSRYIRRWTGISAYTRDGTHRTWGWPVTPPACTPPVCGKPSEPIEHTTSYQPTPQRGDRILVAGVRGKFKVRVSNSHWRAKEAIGLGFRTVYAHESSDSTGASNLAGAVSAEYFRLAEARGGPYGSMAFAQLPCDLAGVGDAVLFANDGQLSITMGCPGRDWFMWDTIEGDRWTLGGQAVGVWQFPLRMAVFDFPKFR